jgi:hypothetical protein
MQTPDRQVVDLDGAEMHFLGVAASAFAVASVNFCTLRRSTLMFLAPAALRGRAASGLERRGAQSDGSKLELIRGD